MSELEIHTIVFTDTNGSKWTYRLTRREADDINNLLAGIMERIGSETLMFDAVTVTVAAPERVEA